MALQCSREELPDPRFPLKHSSCLVQKTEEINPDSFHLPCTGGYLCWCYGGATQLTFGMDSQGYSHPFLVVGAAFPLSIKYFESCNLIWDVRFSLFLAVSSHSPLMRSRAGRQRDAKCRKIIEISTFCQEGLTQASSLSDPPFLWRQLNTAKVGQPEPGSKYRL